MGSVLRFRNIFFSFWWRDVKAFRWGVTGGAYDNITQQQIPTYAGDAECCCASHAEYGSESHSTREKGSSTSRVQHVCPGLPWLHPPFGDWLPIPPRHPLWHTKDVGCRSNFDPSRPLYTQDTGFSVKSSLTAVCQGVQTLSTDMFACDRHTPKYLLGKICCPRNIWARNSCRGADFCEIFTE